MSFSETLWPGIPPRSYPPCPASITTVMGELSLAAYEAHARNVVHRPAANKGTKFLRITGRLRARRAGGPKVWVPCYPSLARTHRPCRLARLFRLYPNEQGGAASWF